MGVGGGLYLDRGAHLHIQEKKIFECAHISLKRERSGSVCRVLDLRSKGRGFKPHRCHCVVSLSKTH